MSNFRFDEDVRRNQLNTDTIVFLKAMTEINFLKFIIYRKLDRLARLNHKNSSDESNKTDKIQQSIPDLLQKLSDWIDFLNIVESHFPSEDFFDDIDELGKDLDKNKISNLDVYIAFDRLKEIVDNYKLKVKND